jgi:hypothetical protein
VEIACSLEPGLAPDRIEDWKAVLAQAVDGQTLPDGVRIAFPRNVDIVTISELAASEQDCCQFFNFAINITSGAAVSLDVTGPEDAQPVILSLFGAPS